MREITTTSGLIFSIDEEFNGEIQGDGGITEGNAPLSYVIDGSDPHDVTCLRLGAAAMRFTQGAVTPISERVPGDLAEWRLGVSQNTISASNRSYYGENPVDNPALYIYQNLEFSPLRSGWDAYLPFSYEPIQFSGMGEQVRLSTKMLNTQASWTVPKASALGEQVACTVSENVKFASWMMLARITAPKEIILLGRMDWSVRTNSTRDSAGTLVYSAGPTEVTRFDQAVVQRLSDNFNAATIPALGNGYSVPDLRMTVDSANYVQGMTNTESDRWRWVLEPNGGYDEKAVPWREFPDPALNPNWLV